MEILADILKRERRAEKFRQMQEEQQNPSKHKKGRRRKRSKKQVVKEHIEGLKNEEGKIVIPAPPRPTKRAFVPVAPTISDFVLADKRTGSEGVKVGELPWERRRKTWREQLEENRRHWNALRHGAEFDVPKYIPEENVRLYRTLLADRQYRFKTRRDARVPERTLALLDLKYGSLPYSATYPKVLDY